MIERGAVIGQVFFRGAVEVLAPEPIREHVKASIESLIEKQLVRPVESYIAGEDAYKFQHVLDPGRRLSRAAEASPGGAPRAVRGLGGARRPGGVEFGEIRGYHLEQAYLTRTQLGPTDEHTRRSGSMGRATWSAAGNRARRGADMHAASSLLAGPRDSFPRTIGIAPICSWRRGRR